MKSLKIVFLAVAFLPICSFADGFSGPYVGAAVGGAFATEKGTGYDDTTLAQSGYTHKTEPAGPLLGLKLGYSKLLPNKLLLGLEVGYDGRSNKDRAYQKNNGVTDLGYRKTTTISSSASVLARVGYALTPKTAAYATAGVSAVKVSRKYETVGVDSESHGTTKSGYVVGVGVEHLLSKNLSTGLEFRHSDYGKSKVNVANWNEFYKERLTDHSVRVGVSYRF